MVALATLALLVVGLIGTDAAPAVPHNYAIQPARKCSNDCALGMGSNNSNDCDLAVDNGPFWYLSTTRPTTIVGSGTTQALAVYWDQTKPFAPQNGMEVNWKSLASTVDGYMWEIVPTTFGKQIKLAGTNFCLDNKDGADRDLQIWQCYTGNANQQWSVVDFGAAKT